MPKRGSSVGWVAGVRNLPPPPWKITKLWASLAMLVRIHWKIINYQASIQFRASIADDGPTFSVICRPMMALFFVLFRTLINYNERNVVRVELEPI